MSILPNIPKPLKKRTVTPRIRKRLPPGSSPGLVKSESKTVTTSIKLLSYNENQVVEGTYAKVDDILNSLSQDRVNWISLEDPTDTDGILAIGKHFNFHKLALEDVIENHQNSKFEIYSNEAYIVLRVHDNNKGLETSQLNIFIQKNTIVTFQNGSIESINRVRDRILQKIGKIRQCGSDYLAYAIIDAIIDTYFPILEKYADQLEDIDSHLLSSSPNVSTPKIHAVKSELLTLRRIIWGHFDLVQAIQRLGDDFLKKETLLFLRDCLDHTKQQLDLTETYREVGANLMDLAFSNANMKANEIMKVLTVITTFFIPLSFISGVYGMNFNSETSPFNMPELNWYLGYPFALGLMLITSTITLTYFYRKKWLG